MQEFTVRKDNKVLYIQFTTENIHATLYRCSQVSSSIESIKPVAMWSRYRSCRNGALVSRMELSKIVSQFEGNSLNEITRLIFNHKPKREHGEPPSSPKKSTLTDILSSPKLKAARQSLFLRLTKSRNTPTTYTPPSDFE